jgi:RNA polymerase sigma factor (sigma-70 family)
MEANLTREPGVATDGDLLKAFAERADQAAFTELVERHGRLVLGVCRRVLADAPDADDAFQATFLILARKARTVRRPERLGSWLYGVALRCAFRVRATARRAKGQPMPDVLPAPAPPDVDWADVRPVLDAEIGRLPHKLRTALVLCELQGLDRPAAAARLGIPLGTLSSRLSRAKEALRRRLIRRGITLSLVAVGLVLTRAAATAAVPPPLAEGTVAAGVRFATGSGSGVAPAVATKVIHAARVQTWVIGAGIGLAVVGVIAVVLWLGRDYFWPDDRKLIQGQWTIVTFKYEGQEILGLGAHTAQINEERIWVGVDGEYTLDPSRTPKEIDLEFLVPGQPRAGVSKGVYELTRDKLIITLAEPGVDRPASVDAGGPKTFTFVMERVKE